MEIIFFGCFFILFSVFLQSSMGTAVRGGYGKIARSPNIRLFQFIHTLHIFQMEVEITQNVVLCT